MSRKNWWELLKEKKDIENKPWEYTPPSERYKRPEPTFDTPDSIEGRTRGIGITTPAIPTKPLGRTRGITGTDLDRFKQPEMEEIPLIRAVPEGWYKEGKLIDTIQTFNSSLLHVGYMSKQFFHDMGTKLLNQPVTGDIEVGGRDGITKTIPMEVANQRRAENIEAGNRAYKATEKGYHDLLARHPEWVPRVEYQGGFIENIKQNPLMLLDPGYISNVAAESLAFSLGTMTITAAATAASGGNIFVGGLAMFMTMYPQEAQGMFETLQEKGMSESEALQTAVWSGALITAIEASSDMYVLMKMIPSLGKPISKTVAKTITNVLTKPKYISAVKAGAIDFFKVSGEEISEEIGQALVEDLTIRIVDETHKVLPDVLEIASRTFISTLGFGSVAGVRGGVTQYRKNMLNMALEAKQKRDVDPVTKTAVTNMLKAVKKAEDEQTTPETEIKTGQPYLADVYRGTKEGAPTDEGLFGKGTYYTTNEEYAGAYGKVGKAKIKLVNPLVINDQKEADAFFNKYTRPERKKAIDEGKTPKEANEIAATKTKAKLVELGYDGIIARDVIERGDEVVVFDVPKSKIKLADIPEGELDVSGTTEQIDQTEITHTGTEEIGDVGTPKVEPELDETLFTPEEQELYTKQKPLAELKTEEAKLRETLKTETKSLKDFEKQKRELDSLYKKYVRAQRDELNKDRTTPKTEIEAIAFGQVKMRVPVGTKTEWKEALGTGYYANVFSSNPNLSTPDEVASDLQRPMSEDQLRQEIAEILKQRPKKYTLEDAERTITDPEIVNIKVRVETMGDMISVLQEEILTGEKKVEPTKQQITELEALLEQDPRFKKAAENLYDKNIDQLSRTEVDTIIMQLNKAQEIMAKTKGFRRPTLIGKLLTPHIVYSEVLGVKPIVAATEKGKQEQDIEYRNASNISSKVIGSLNKGVTTIRQKFTAFKRNKPTPIEAKMAELLNTYEVAPKNLSKQEAKVFKYLDNLRTTLLRRQNEVRAELGLRPIQGKKAYFKHVIDVMAEAAMLKYGLLETDTTNPVDFRDFPFPEEIIRFIEKKVAEGVYNPAAIRRKLGDELSELWTKDLRLVTNSMLWTALKEIHLAKPLKGLVESLDALDTVPGTIPASTKRWLVDYVNQVIKGQENETDVEVNDILNQSGLKGFLDKLLLPYGRRLGPKPLTKLLAGTGKLIIYAVMGPIPRQILRNTFQTIQNLALYGVRATIKGIFSAPKQCKELMNDSIYYRSYTGLEGIPEGTLSKLGELWLKGYQMSAIWNAGNAMKAAYHFNMSKITGKYQNTKYSWADSERTVDTPEGFLFDSEKEKLLKEMEWGARSTQYQYTPLGMPGIFRFKAAVPFTRLQSWWMNYFFNFTREAATRMFKGENGYGVKLPPSERLNYAKYLLIGGIILNGLGYKKSFGFGVMPMYLSPAAGAASALYHYVFAQNDYERQKGQEALKRSFQALIPGYLGVKTWTQVLNGDISMEELFFYGKTEKKKTTAQLTSAKYKSPKDRYKKSNYKTLRQRYKK